MARAKRNTVDYFPHKCNHGKTLQMFERKYPEGVGYSFWFKLLELLCKAPDHYYNFSEKYNRIWLSEYCLGDPEKIMEAKEMLDFLVDLNAIDLFLFENDRLIWSQNFVDNLKGVYEKRTNDLPIKPIRNGNPAQVSIPARIHLIPDHSAPKTPQSKVKDSKEKKSIVVTKSKFIIPTKEEMAEYGKEMKIPISIVADCWYHYDKVGWIVGKAKLPMVSWKSALSGWWNREKRKSLTYTNYTIPKYSRANYGDKNMISIKEVFENLREEE